MVGSSDTNAALVSGTLLNAMRQGNTGGSMRPVGAQRTSNHRLLGSDRIRYPLGGSFLDYSELPSAARSNFWIFPRLWRNCWQKPSLTKGWSYICSFYNCRYTYAAATFAVDHICSSIYVQFPQRLFTTFAVEVPHLQFHTCSSYIRSLPHNCSSINAVNYICSWGATFAVPHLQLSYHIGSSTFAVQIPKF